MRTYSLLTHTVLFVLILAACSPATAVPTELPTALPTPIPATDIPPATEEPTAGPAEFVWSMTGEPNALDVPADIDTDAQDNLYVLDAGNDRIQVFDPDGQFITMWGESGEEPGQFNFRRANGDAIGAIALDAQGNVYVADNANQRIQKFDRNGTFLLEWGSNGAEDGQFLSPIGVDVDQQGNVYVIDDARDDIQKFDGEGNFLLKWGRHGSADGQFNYTGTLALDEQGNVFVADFSNHRVQKFDSQGTFLSKWGSFGKETGQFNDPSGIAVDPQGNIYVIEYAAHPPETYRVQAFDEARNVLGTWGSPGNADGEFTHPLAIAVDGQGNVYVSDETNRVQKFRLNFTPTAAPAAQTKAFPASLCCNGKTVEPGAYEIPAWWGIPLTMEVGEGWRAINEEAARLFLLGKGRNIFQDPTQVLVFMAVPNGDPQAILASIKNEQGLSPINEISETTIAGFSGLQLDFSAKANLGYEGEKESEIPPGVQFLPVVNKYFTPGFLWTTWTAEPRLRFIALNVGEQTLLIEIESPPAEFEAFVSETDQILQTLKLRR